MSWQGSIILEKGEQLVNSWECNHEMTTTAVAPSNFGFGNKQMQGARVRKVGILALTNHRLIFLEAHGVFGKSYHPASTIPLEKLGGISMGGLLMPFVLLSGESDSYTFHIRGISKNEFPAFRQTITDLCQKRKEELDAEKRKERVQIVLDFSTLRDYMEKGGLVLQKTKCPECNAPIPIPTSGNQVVCQHCGSTILAQDIFEKIKSLI